MTDEELQKLFQYDNGTLRNKANIRNAEKLSDYEYRTVAKNTLWLLNRRRLFIPNGVDDLAKIHKFLFGEIYDWAGEFRNYYLSKNGTDFMPPTAFKAAFHNINLQVKTINLQNKPNNFNYAKLLDSVNYLHPFREGNGRTTRLFIQLIAIGHNQFISYDRQSKEVIRALQNSNIQQLSNFMQIEDVVNKQEALKKAATKQFILINKKQRHNR